MAMSRREEARALDTEERDLVARSHHPQVQEVDDTTLVELATLIRRRRDRARDMAHQKRREMRGKGAPRGAGPAARDGGTRLKLEALAAAMKRLNGERARRKRLRGRMAMVASQQRALEMAQAVGRPHEGFNTRTAHQGMQEIANIRNQRIGSAREGGRVSQFVRNAQAKRDGR